MRWIFVVPLLIAMVGCKTNFDLSPEAYASGDFTLIGALSNGPCKSIPVQGADVCRVKEGADVESVWRLVIPFGRGVDGGQITVYWKDFSKTYPVNGRVIEVPLRDLMKGSTWDLDDTDVATALGEIRWTDSDGLKRTSRAEGMAAIIVLKKGYEPMPIDSGSQNWSLKCTVQYSTSGRSALECK